MVQRTMKVIFCKRILPLNTNQYLLRRTVLLIFFKLIKLFVQVHIFTEKTPRLNGVSNQTLPKNCH